MNQEQRKALNILLSKIEEIKEEITSFQEQEEEKYNNLSEGLQATENGQKLETIAEHLSDAVSNLETAIDDITNAIEL